MWLQQVKEENVDSFENVIPCMKAHISALHKTFPEIFPDAASQRIWLDAWPSVQHHPLTSPRTNSSVTSPGSTIGLQLQSKTLAVFWISVQKDDSLLGKRTLATLFPPRENTDQSWTLKINSGIWKLQRRSEKICSMKEAHIRHWQDVRIKGVIFAQQTFNVFFFSS